MNNVNNFIKKLLSGKKSSTDLIDQLYKRPLPDKDGDNTTFSRISSGYIQYADTLYLPNDKGYIYALVITDQGNRKVDLEPMQARKLSDIVKALKAILELVTLINEEVDARNKKIHELPLEEQNFTSNPKHKIKMLKDGDKVRTELSNPEDINGKRLHDG